MYEPTEFYTYIHVIPTNCIAGQINECLFGLTVSLVQLTVEIYHYIIYTYTTYISVYTNYTEYHIIWYGYS